MKRLLLALLAAFAFPTTVNAETVWLVIFKSVPNDGAAFEKIEMKDMAQCLEQGEILRTTEHSHRDKSTQGIRYADFTSFICLKGK